MGALNGVGKKCADSQTFSFPHTSRNASFIHIHVFILPADALLNISKYPYEPIHFYRGICRSTRPWLYPSSLSLLLFPFKSILNYQRSADSHKNLVIGHENSTISNLPKTSPMKYSCSGSSIPGRAVASTANALGGEKWWFLCLQKWGCCQTAWQDNLLKNKKIRVGLLKYPQQVLGSHQEQQGEQYPISSSVSIPTYPQAPRIPPCAGLVPPAQTPINSDWRLVMTKCQGLFSSFFELILVLPNPVIKGYHEKHHDGGYELPTFHRFIYLRPEETTQ